MRSCLMIVLLGLLPGWQAAAQGPAQTPHLVQSLPQLCDFQMRRITSVDPSGGNDDFRDLLPGRTLVVAEIKGPGCIVHLRDNITSSEPHHLQKHVLRMYWDGETTPSVEVPSAISSAWDSASPKRSPRP